jgi:peptidoglycan hydrolase CwlO-like protein
MATIGIVGGILAILVSIGTLASFVIYLFKEAIAKGRLYQRIDYIEKNQNDSDAKHEKIDEKIGCHDNDIVKVNSEQGSLRALMERMDKKLDTLLMERRE